MVTPNLRIPTLAILSACILTIAYDGTRLAQDRRFNQALAEIASEIIEVEVR